MTELERLFSAVEAADAAGDAEAAGILFEKYKRVKAGVEKSIAEDATAPVSPTEGMGRAELLAAGVNQGMRSLVRGAGQRLGMVSQETVDEMRALESPLLDTGYGTAGSVIGQAAPAVAASFIPGAAPAMAGLGGNAAVGAGMGLLTPTATGESVTKNTLLGGALGGVGALAGRAIAGAPRVLRAVTDPFSSAGRERVAENVIRESVGGNTDDLVRALQTAPPSATPGYQPTLAELTANPGVRSLERSLEGVPGAGGVLASAQNANRAVLRESIDALAGTPEDLVRARAAREAAAGPLYASARQAAPVPIDEVAERVLRRPAIARAIENVRRNFANEGEPFGLALPQRRQVGGMMGVGGATQFTPGSATPDLLHQVKLELDSMLKAAGTARPGAEGLSDRAIRTARDELLDLLETNVPDYAAARTTFARESLPVNERQVMQEMRDRFVPAIADAQGPQMGGMRPNALASALRDADAVAQRATRFPGATYESVTTPEARARLAGILSDAARLQGTLGMDRIAGSATASNLANQNMTSAITNALGLPRFLQPLVQTGAQTVATPLGVATRGFEQQTQEVLATLLANPQRVQQLLTGSGPQAGFLPAIDAAIVRALQAEPQAVQEALRALPSTFGAASGAAMMQQGN